MLVTTQIKILKTLIIIRQQILLPFLLYDTGQLGILLYLTGGIFNPFCILVIAPVIISASYLPVFWTIILSFFSIILILFIYLNKEYFNYEIKNYFLKFNKKEFLINNQNKNSFDLIFNQIEKEVTILNDNQRIIKIFGKISNTSNIESYKIPKLQVTLIDSKNNIITTWFFNAEQENLGPQESLNFNTSYIHNSQDIADIKIEFYKEEK